MAVQVSGTVQGSLAPFWEAFGGDSLTTTHDPTSARWVLCDLPSSQLLWGSEMGGSGRDWTSRVVSDVRLLLLSRAQILLGRGRPDGAQKLGLPLDWSHTAAHESRLSSLGCFNVVFFLVNLRPAICLLQEAAGKREAGLGCQLWGPLDPGDGQSLGSSRHHGVARAGCSGDNLERLSLETWREGQGWWEHQESGKGKGRDGRRV